MSDYSKTVELVVLVGIQASGKTTFYRQRLAGQYAHVSLDNWRGKDNVRKREYEAILNALRSAGQADRPLCGVVVDNTNITVQTRRRYFEYAAEFARQGGRPLNVLAYWFDEDLPSCLARNERRPKEAPVGTPYYVPPSAIAGFASRLEPPTYAEGFAAIFRIRTAQGGAFLVEELPRH